MSDGYPEEIQVEFRNVDLEEVIFDSRTSDDVLEEGLNSIFIDGLSSGMHEIIVVDTYGDGMYGESYVSITSGSLSDPSDSPLIYIAGKSLLLLAESSEAFEVICFFNQSYIRV